MRTHPSPAPPPGPTDLLAGPNDAANQGSVREIPTADGEAMAVWTRGHGDPLIALAPAPRISIAQTRSLLRRFGADRDPWYLSGYQTIRYDPQGAGASSGVADFRLDSQVRDLAAVTDATAGRPVLLIAQGHSGPTAIAYAHAHPERVALLVLWCTYASAHDYFTGQRVSTIFRVLPGDWGLFLNAMTREVLGSRFSGAREVAEVLRSEGPGPRRALAALRQVRDIDVTELLAGLRVPTLVCQRADGPPGGRDIARRLAAAVSGAELVLFPGDSPLAFAERPDLIHRVVLAAAERVARPSADPTPLQFLVDDDDAAASPLTPREHETLVSAAIGLSNEEIAEQLAISLNTVKNHLAATFAKLDVANRTDAVRRARERGLID